MSVSYKPFSELAAANTLIAADIIPVVTTTGGNNSKKITYETFAQTVSSTLIGPFTTTITAVEPASAGKWNSTYTTVQTNSATWGAGSSAGGLTIFRQISSIASPNNPPATTVHALSIISSETNVDIAILSKGTGATLAQIPDDQVAGGAKRGQYATDFQKSRAGQTQVANGNYSVIGGGSNNTASGNYSLVVSGSSNISSGGGSVIGGGVSNISSNTQSTIGGGLSGTASGIYSTIGGGVQNVASAGSSTVGGGAGNTASNTYSTVGGGATNIASGSYSTIGGGNNNVLSGSYSTIGGGRNSISNGFGSVVAGGSNNASLSTYSTIGGGYTNIASGYGSTIGGGYNNIASADYSTVIGGVGGKATLPGQLVYSNGSFITEGDAQMSTFLLTKTTSSAVSSVCVLASASGTSEITMLSAETLFVTATIACLSSQENGAGYFGIIKGVARCNAAGNVTIYNPVEVSASRSTGTAATFNAGLSASGNKLRVVVYVNSTQTFRWNAKLDALSINGVLS